MPNRYCKAGDVRSHPGRFVGNLLLLIVAVATLSRPVVAAGPAPQHAPFAPSGNNHPLPAARMPPPRAMAPPHFASPAGGTHGRMFSGRTVSRYRWPGGLPYRLYAVGALLPLSFIAADYIISDWAAYGVPAPAGNAVWLRYGPDLLLVDQQTGQVQDAAYGVFVEDTADQPAAPPPVQQDARETAPPPPAAVSPAGPTPSDREYAATRPTYAPPPAPPVPADREQRVVQFVQEFFARVTGNAADVLDYEQRTYASNILFYGHPLSRSAVLEQKAAYMKRWPICVNTVRPASTTVVCANESLCTFSGLVDWDCRAPLRPEGPAHACGTSSVTFDLDTGGGASPMKIVGESSSVVSRCP
jgi:Ni/Co efflux regulator RcnB